MPGMMKKGAMYQAGGPVKSPERKRRGMDGGQKGVPVMTPEQRRQARSMMTDEERREADAPLTARELEGMSSRFKKGGVVKKAMGGMVGRVRAGSNTAPDFGSMGPPRPPTSVNRTTTEDIMGRGRSGSNRSSGFRGLRDLMMSRTGSANAPVKKKAGGVVKKAKGGMIGKGCK
jgi:hypothetical protein